MTQRENPQIIFLRVTDSQTKIHRIVGTVQQHFLSGDTVIIHVPSQQAAEYIDSLLWRLPQDSFLPHIVTNNSCIDRVVITEESRNLNKANVALNLTSRACRTLDSYEKIYELYDQSDRGKAKQSEDKMQKYRELGLLN